MLSAIRVLEPRLQERDRALAHVVGATEGVACHSTLAVPPLAVMQTGAAIRVRAPGSDTHVGRKVLDSCACFFRSS